MPSEVLKERTFHLPTYLVDDKGGDGTVTLFVRHFKLVRTPKGNLSIRHKLDTREFADADEMLAAIEDEGMIELPAEADGDPNYVPDEFYIPGARLTRTGRLLPEKTEVTA